MRGLGRKTCLSVGGVYTELSQAKYIIILFHTVRLQIIGDVDHKGAGGDNAPRI